MPSERQSHPAASNSLSMKLGDWFEAHATGWGVAAIPASLALLAAFAAVRLFWG